MGGVQCGAHMASASTTLAAVASGPGLQGGRAGANRASPAHDLESRSTLALEHINLLPRPRHSTRIALPPELLSEALTSSPRAVFR